MYEDIEIDLTTTPQVWHRPWAALIQNTAFSSTDEVFVIIPGIDPQRKWGPCPWQPIQGPKGLTYPFKNDEALVHFDDDHKCWIMNWSPATYTPDADPPADEDEFDITASEPTISSPPADTGQAPVDYAWPVD